MPETTLSNMRPFQPKPVPGPRGHFLLGSLPDVQRGPLEFLLAATREYGNFIRYRFAFFTGYLANNPDYIKHILQENNRNYNKQNFDYQMLRPVVGQGLLTSDGALWLRQRRLIQPAFHRQRIQAFGQLMTSSALLMLENWQSPKYQEQPFDVSREMMRLTLSIVGKALFSQDVSAEADVIGQAFTTVNAFISTRFRSLITPPLNWPTPSNRRFHASMQAMDEVVNRVIRTRRAALEKGENGEANDLLSMLLLARDEETGEGMNDAQLRDEVITLLLAGHETTANALSWTWYLLSKNPEVESRLRAELNKVLAGHTPSIEDLPRLHYTRMVILESMRLYPPAWIISRKAEEEDQIGAYLLPAGARVAISPYVMHRHPDFWENPEEFDPQRFSPERSAARPAYAYIPFGGGPRLCIGRDFALVEAQLILATIAQHYHLDLLPDHPVEPEPLITLRPKYGLKMTLRPV